MRFRVLLYIAGIINIILGIAMLAPTIVSLFYKDGDTKAIFFSSVITLSTGVILFFSCKTRTDDISHREGFLIVALSWITASLFGSLPYILSGVLPSFVDAVFESTSGITTTGSSVITDVEIIPHGIIFWRSMMHWMGGMGIVLLGIAILPFLGVGGLHIYKAETSSISGEKFVPSIKKMARILFAIYLFLNFISLVLFLIVGMGIFDAFIHMFGTLATGGFSSKNLSIGHYDNPALEFIVMAIMAIGGTNFFLHYMFYREGLRVYIENEEFKFYISLIIISTLVMTINLTGIYGTIFESLRYASFQVVSAVTCTGYSSADYNNWPHFSQILLIALMFIGGSAGSTAGAIKCVRILLVFKIFRKEFNKLIHPHAITSVKINGKTVPPEILKSVMSFTLIYIFTAVASASILTSQGINVTASIASVATSMGNVGFGLGLPGGNYSTLADLSKWVLIFDMLTGRLEIYTILILFVPAFWKG